MKMTTGRIANPRKRKAPAKRRTATVAKRRTRRANPGHMAAVVPQTMITRDHFAPAARKANPRRKAVKHASGGIFMSPNGRSLTRRANPSGPGVVAGVSISETALMVLSGGAAAFAGAVVVRFVDEKFTASKYTRVAVKTTAALTIGFLGMKAAESNAMGGRIVIPIAIGFAAPMIASAIDDIFDRPSTTTSALARRPAMSDIALNAIDDTDDDDEVTINGLDPLDDIDDDVASLYESGDLDDDMDGLDDCDDDDDDENLAGFGPQAELMGSTVRLNPTRGLSSFAANFMQGLTMARA